MKQLAIARLRTIPQEYQITVGDVGNLSRDEVIQNIIENSDIGKKMVSIQMDFIRDMADGDLYDRLYE